MIFKNRDKGTCPSCSSRFLEDLLVKSLWGDITPVSLWGMHRYRRRELLAIPHSETRRRQTYSAFLPAGGKGKGHSSLSWASQVAPVVKNPPGNAGDVRDAGSIPELGASPRGGHGWRSLVSYRSIHRVEKSQTGLKHLDVHVHTYMRTHAHTHLSCWSYVLIRFPFLAVILWYQAILKCLKIVG